MTNAARRDAVSLLSLSENSFSSCFKNKLSETESQRNSLQNFFGGDRKQ